MADPQAALLTQVRNIQAKTGKTLVQLHALLESSGLAKHGEKRSWLMETLGLGYGDANTVVTLQGKPLPAGLEGAAPAAAVVASEDPLDAIYSGNKAALRPLHEAVMAQIQTLGDFEIAPKKAYLSLRRSKQFAMVGPATAKQIEIGLNCKTLAEHPRLKHLPPGGMCQASTRIESADQIDAELMAWLRAAFESAA
ncbi:hypothetical protein HNQ51_002522 [Inhella inkyongensis]|uniref:DUF5655 domain-containing protein n=1 Tax=Inhella inkyongensis TaxID=392593 RepID=A0A840S681_9BURK|nr:DUF5655 domain-containing protein [Inhella inkyongensis]MBB5205203.1 hypothetical protein [Inhella inkyongensis]